MSVCVLCVCHYFCVKIINQPHDIISVLLVVNHKLIRHRQLIGKYYVYAYAIGPNKNLLTIRFNQ